MGSNVTVTRVESPGNTGLRENSGTVQPHEVTTSRITTGRSPRLTPVKVWLTRPPLSSMRPKSHASGVKTSCADTQRGRHKTVKIKKICFFEIIIAA